MKQFALFGLLVLVTGGISACSDAPDSPPPGRAPGTVFSIGSDGDHPVLRNKEGDLGNVRDTEIAVMSGDRVEIRPGYLVREERKPLPPQVTRQDDSVCTQYNNVCVATQPIFQLRCENHCSVCMKWSWFPPGLYPGTCCNESCRNIHVGDQCTQTQAQCVQQANQWVEQTVYPGLSESQTVQDTAPMKSAALLTAGLKLRFSYEDANGKPQQSECSLDQFKPAVDSEKITVQLANVEACPSIFAVGAKSSPTLSLVNTMELPTSYPQGTLVKTWDGRTPQQPTDTVYLPIIDFAGTITVFAGGN